MDKAQKKAGGKGLQVAERAVFAVFLVMAATLVSGWIYRRVSGSGWYQEKQVKEAFRELAQKLEDPESIRCIKIDRLGSETQVLYDMPENLFEELGCFGYAQVTEEDRRREIFASDVLMTVWKDGSSCIFHITEEGEIYWNYLRVDCPPLVKWYSSLTDQ